MKKPFFRTTLSFAFVFFGVASFSSLTLAEIKRGGTLIQLIQNTPRHLNPAVQSGSPTGEPGTQLFAAPLRYDENWTPQPYLAESWNVSDNGLSFTLNLVKGAVFHDGKPITSEDVAFSIETVKKNHPFKTMYAPVQKIDIPDKHTVILHLSQPHPALLLAMSSQLLPIIPKHIYGDGQDPKNHPANSEGVVGSGPFKLVEFKRDQHVILERNENFFIKGRPYVDKIVMRIIKDGTSRVIALENGEAHLSGFENNPLNINRLKRSTKLDVTAEGYAAIGPLTWLAFNTKRKLTGDVNVRRAIAYAIDREFINKAIMLGTSSPAKTGIHPGSHFYSAQVKSYDLDLKKANEILDQAGYKKGADGFRFKLDVHYGWQSLKRNAEYTKAQLKKIGINVVIKASPDFPTWAKNISNYEFDLTWDTVFNWGDPVIGVHRTYQSSNIKKGVIWSNTQNYSNDEVDALMAQAAVEDDLEKRKALYARFQRVIARDLPLYPVNTEPYHTISSKKIGNAPRGIWATVAPLDRVYFH